MGFPNIEYVVGTRGTLAIDTGMGPQNGAVVVKEAAKLSKNPLLYLTTTHFHPEHSSGEQAFPPGTVLIRNQSQQDELEKRGQEYIDLFSSRSAVNKELLKDVKLRRPDILYDREMKLDLGGVTVRLFWLGTPAHTRGDQMIFVEEDSTLIPGDIVQNKLVPNMPNSDASVKGWIGMLDKLAALNPKYILPDHGALGDGSLIAQEKAWLVDLQTRALDAKRKGLSADDAAKQVATDMKAKYPDWEGNAAGNAVRRVYEEAQ